MLQRERAQSDFIIQRLFKRRLLYARLLLRTTQHAPFCSYLFFFSSKTSPVISSKPSPLLCFLSWALRCPLFDTFSKWLHFSPERSTLDPESISCPLLNSTRSFFLLRAFLSSSAFCRYDNNLIHFTLIFSHLLLIFSFCISSLKKLNRSQVERKLTCAQVFKWTDSPTFLSSINVLAEDTPLTNFWELNNKLFNCIIWQFYGKLISFRANHHCRNKTWPQDMLYHCCSWQC